MEILSGGRCGDRLFGTRLRVEWGFANRKRVTSRRGGRRWLPRRPTGPGSCAGSILTLVRDDVIVCLFHFFVFDSDFGFIPPD